MRQAWAVCAFVVSTAAGDVARAQSKEDVASADALFNAAKALLEAHQYPDACAKFAESKRLAPGLGVTLYLADCYERIGRTASAWTEFRAAEGLARARSDARADVARERAQSLEAKLDRLTVTVAPTVPRAGLRVLLDGAPVPPEEWGLAIAVDPGDHAVVVASPDHPTKTLTAHVGPEARSTTVHIDGLDEHPAPASAPAPTPTPASAPTPTPASAPAPAPPSAPAPEQASSAPAGSAQRWVGLGVGGAGVVGVILGSAFGFVAKSKLDQSNSGGASPPCDASNRCSQAGLSLRQDAGSAATASTVAFIAGGVAIAAGAVIYITAPRAAAATAWVLTPTPLAGGGGALLRTTF